MRRVALLAEDVAAAAAGAWLNEVTGGEAVRCRTAVMVPWSGIDVLWVHDVPTVPHGVLEWLEGGGRLFASGAAAPLASHLGLEPVVASPIAGLDADVGLAAFGDHPLFDGLDRTAGPWRTRPGTVTGYDRVRPRVARAVGVEYRNHRIAIERVLAWETDVGLGGLLCVGALPPLDALARGDDPALARFLLNALTGDAVPHHTRAAPAPHWPAPGRAASLSPRQHVELPVPGDEWFAGDADRLALPGGALPTGSGRRLMAVAEPDGWSVWAHPVRALTGARVRAAKAGGSWIERGAACRELTGALTPLRERWVAALDVPAAVWEVDGDHAAPVELEWTVDLRLASPYPPGASGDLGYGVSEDARRLTVRSAGGLRAEFVASGGTLRALPSETTPLVRVEWVGRTPVRILVIAAGGDEESVRSARALAREDRRPVEVRRRHEAQAARSVATVEMPDPALGQAVAWSLQRLDALLCAVPGPGLVVLGRCPASDPAGWCIGPSAVRAAVAQLAFGRRDPARDLIALLARSVAPDGRLVLTRSLAGPAGLPDHGDTALFLHLIERYAAWTADTDLLARHDSVVRSARALLASRGAGPAPLPPPPELDAAVRRFQADPAAPDADPPVAVLDAVSRGLWGAEPDAPAGAVAFRPALPADWTAAALRRLRVGRTVLDLELRRRRTDLVARMHRIFGPPLTATVEPRGAFDEAVVDDVVLGAGRARFMVADRHDVVFRAASV